MKTKYLQPIISSIILFALIFSFYSFIQKENNISKIESQSGTNANGEEVNYGTNKGELLYNYDLKEITTDEAVNIEDFTGKKKILFFWASWCPYCKQTAPALEKIQNENEDVEAIGLTVPGAENAKNGPFDFIEELGLTYGNYEAQKELYDHFTIQSFPTMVFVNSDNTIAEGVIGGLTEEIIKTQLEKMY